ncbi:hypothetical protein SSABA_v1c08010 [Spiroplasma sabaudiense Ar-1343]|uniref:Uncharacterized protein n=1 Tax=Spiroplasma sabaudiense Ar-1343 TaxID=1276257 RepID=W6AB05_9MOLU|nr:hypothetical protein [Spiroplasma sabaudiense]AHI54202.1 hypothetical protein SSABA_v1c08010 [Spiroplasma sabaudiense Ar-1343]
MASNQTKTDDFLFLFCKNCWNYQKFQLSKNQEQTLSQKTTFLCLKCNLEQNVDLEKIQNYYEVLNEHNN